MSPFEVTLGDNSKLEVAQRAASVQVALDQSRAMIDRHEVAINEFDQKSSEFAGYAKDTQVLVDSVRQDIDLWDIRAYKLRRLCYWAIGIPGGLFVIEAIWVGAHLIH